MGPLEFPLTMVQPVRDALNESQFEQWLDSYGPDDGISRAGSDHCIVAQYLKRLTPLKVKVGGSSVLLTRDNIYHYNPLSGYEELPLPPRFRRLITGHDSYLAHKQRSSKSFYPVSLTAHEAKQIWKHTADLAKPYVPERDMPLYPETMFVPETEVPSFSGVPVSNLEITIEGIDGMSAALSTFSASLASFEIVNEPVAETEKVKEKELALV